MDSSRIIKLKSKFFLYRALIYFSFLLLPVWIQKVKPMDPGIRSILMIFYIFFMAGQWFLLGKEIDHRLKIYFKANSSMDRLIYRLILGMSTVILYFWIVSLFPKNYWDDIFWSTWAVSGLFYSWPTRGKIIKESVTTQLSEFKFLDAFEKTTLVLSILIFIISVPQLAILENIEALKLFFDPFDKFSQVYWNFLYLNYYPFHRYPALFKLAWFLHFYICGLGIGLVSFYATLRFFFSRRVSLLGIFAFLSSWSLSKILMGNVGASISTTYSIIWIWSLLWVAKSSTYRAGLFVGMLSFLGTLINQTYGMILIATLLLYYYYFFRDQTYWFRKQFLKYTIPGIALTIITVFINFESLKNFYKLDLVNYFQLVTGLISRKAFLSLSIIGAVLLFIKLAFKDAKISQNFRVDMERLKSLVVSLFVLLFFAIFFESFLLDSFTLLAILVFLSLIPVEWVFQSISRLRSRRNIMYMIYFLVCLLDSHLEGRIKILLTYFKN